MKIIYKFLFDLFTSPLGLPIDAKWEYLILSVIGAIAFWIAWKISPGGLSGSRIHWFVRGFCFVALWSIAYVIIAIVKWIEANPITAIFTAVTVITLAVVIYMAIKNLIKNHHKTKKET